MDRINFSHNWNNKLNCNIFTTVRNIDKLSYYEERRGSIFEILLMGRVYSTARLIDVILIDLKDSNKYIEILTKILLMLDTGLRECEYEKVFEKFNIKDKAVLLVFEKIN